MDTRFSEEDLKFQAEVREFFQRVVTPELKARLADEDTAKEAQVEWQHALYEKGWFALSWPKEYGGTGWSATQKFLFEKERAASGVTDVIPFGVKLAGPIIYTFGTQAQKERFLPGILSSEEWWCQGYSEPGAGSDLAALKTKAVLDGDHYVVNGAKIWTSYAQNADWIFCLVRTNSDGKKQQGITFLLIDMKSPGIEVNPIESINGRHSLNEVVFNDVRVPVENRIGEQDKGWTYAKALLDHERLSIARVATSRNKLAALKKFASTELSAGKPLINDPIIQQRISDVEIELMALEYTELRVLASVAAGEAPGPESSLLKIKGSEISQTVQELTMDVAGYYAGVPLNRDGSSPSGHEFGSDAYVAYMYGRSVSIYGGSNEIQKNIIVKAVLGL